MAEFHEMINDLDADVNGTVHFIEFSPSTTVKMNKTGNGENGQKF